MVLWITDEDRDGTVTTGELRTLEIKANKWAAKDTNFSHPKTVKELCDTVFINFDRDELRREFELKSGACDELKLISETLQVWGVCERRGGRGSKWCHLATVRISYRSPHTAPV